MLAEATDGVRTGGCAGTGLVMEALVPAVLEQKVTGQEAFAGFRLLVHRFGERAPGAGVQRGLWVQPAPETIRMIPSWEWLRMHVDPARSRTVVRAASWLRPWSGRWACPVDDVDRRLRSLPGVGVWTSAEVRFRAHGDADAVSFGDYHVAKDVGWALTGDPGRRRRHGRAARAVPSAPAPRAEAGRAGRPATVPGAGRGWPRADTCLGEAWLPRDGCGQAPPSGRTSSRQECSGW